MLVFVTGARGFVGTGVCRALMDAGHDVTGLTSCQAGADELRKLGIEPVVGDMRDASVVGPPAAEADATIVCAKIMTVGRLSNKKLREANEAQRIHGRVLAEAAEKKGRRVVFSAGYLLHGDRADGWSDETCPMNPPEFSVGYRDAIQHLLERHEAGALKACAILPGFVYGPLGFFAQLVEMIRAGKFKLAGGGYHYWSPVYLGDLGAAYVAAAEGKADGRTVLVVDDEPMPMREIAFAIADAVGAKRPKSVPKLMVRLFMGKAMVEAFTLSKRSKNDLAKELLGWKPKYSTLRDGLPSVIEQLSGTE